MLAQLGRISRKFGLSLLQLPRALALTWAASRGWTLLWWSLLLAQGLLPVGLVYLTKTLVDSLTAAIGAGGDWQRIRPVLVQAALMMAMLLLTEILRSAASLARNAQAELLRDHISLLIHQKSSTVDFAFYEAAEFYDHLHRARQEASSNPISLIESLGAILRDTVTLAAILLVLLPFGWWLPLLLLLGTLPALVVVLRHTLRMHEWRRRISADERRAWYYDNLLTSAEAAAELRVFGLAGYFQSAYQHLRRHLRREQLRLSVSRSLAEFGAGALALGSVGAAWGEMARQAFAGTATLGLLALFYQAFNQGQQLMRSLLASIGALYTSSLFLTNLFEFFALRALVVTPHAPEAPPQTITDGIRFDHVTFTYPGSERPALRDFSLKVPAGRITAIVGLNGAGKTTLFKLLCRLFDPDSGRIEIDGIDLRQLAVDDLRQLVSVLFQQPVRYNATVAENIKFSVGAGARAEAAEIEAAACAAGAEEIVARLPQGYETVLGKQLGKGVELSVGEWQRLALARAFLRRAPILLLDEPTSSMDAWAEADWARRFRAAAAGRTVIIITHRFTTARQAHTIHVMENGRIVESGTHQELLALGGRYASSWRTQMEELAPNSL